MSQVNQEKEQEKMETQRLLEELARIKKWEKESAARKAQIYEILSKRATFKDGSMTGHLYGGNIHMTYQRRFNVKYDQDLLQIAMQKIGEAPFEAVFKRKYEPRSKAALKSFFQTATAEQKDLIERAMEEKEGSPYVTLEVIDNEGLENA